MKKTLSLVLALVLALSVCATAFAADAADVFVSISDGTLVLARQSVKVSDVDEDGTLTVYDALYCAHEAYYPDGAAGFGTTMTDYGLSLTKLWGVEQGFSYGYYVNNAAAWSLMDVVKGGDHLYAFCYTDAEKCTDAYAYFDQDTVTAKTFSDVELTLTALVYDMEAWQYVEVPVAGAKITIDGKKTPFETDENGKVTIAVASAGKHTVSAQSGSMLITPPVCTVVGQPGGFIPFVIRTVQSIVDFIRGLFVHVK